MGFSLGIGVECWGGRGVTEETGATEDHNLLGHGQGRRLVNRALENIDFKLRMPLTSGQGFCSPSRVRAWELKGTLPKVR